MQRTFTSKEVVALTRISARQLQWWDEQGIVVPARDGHKRCYSIDDLAEVAILCELRDAVSPCKKFARVLRFLQKELGKRLVETVTAASEYHLLTDGRHIYLEDSARGVVDLLKNARQPMLTVCLSDAIQRVLDPTAQRNTTRSAPKAVSAGAGKNFPQRRPPRGVELRAGVKRNGSVRHHK